jgi:threonine dehydrogenase-like Zn-dependent dehydrogenase
MGQANVWRWVPELLPLLADGATLDVAGFATHHLPLAEAPQAYAAFQAQDGMIKTLLRP